MLFSHIVNRIAGIIIVFCLLIGCSHGKRTIEDYKLAISLLDQAKNAPDFATKEACIKTAGDLYPSKWLLLKTLYVEEANAQERLEDKIFHLEQALGTVNKYSIDYHRLEIYRKIGELYYKNHDIDQALSCYKKMLDIETKYVNQKQTDGLFFKSLFTEYLDDCLTMGKMYLDIGDKTSAIRYFKESGKYFHKLQQSAYKDKTLFLYLADKFIQLGDIYEGLGLHEEKISCYEMGIKFKLLNLEYRFDNEQLDLTMEKELKSVIAFREAEKGEELENERLWAKFLLAKYYAEQDMREFAVDYITQVLDSDFEYLANVGNIMTIMRYIPGKFIFRQENQREIHIMGHNRQLLELMLKKYRATSKTFYKRFTLEDLHNWLLISLLAEDYSHIKPILKKTLELKPNLYTEKNIRLWNIILHNIGVAHFRKSDYKLAEFYFKQYYRYSKDLLSTFNLAVVYLTINDSTNAQKFLLKYKKQYPNTVFFDVVKKYLKDSKKYLAAGNPDSLSPIELKQSVVPIAR